LEPESTSTIKTFKKSMTNITFKNSEDNDDMPFDIPKAQNETARKEKGKLLTDVLENEYEEEKLQEGCEIIVDCESSDYYDEDPTP
jgi:hypothetical protein